MNKYFIEYYYALKNMYVASVKKSGNNVFVQGDIIDDSIWNFVYSGTLEEINIKEIENKFKLMNLIPAIMIDIKCEIEGYAHYCTDAWMILNNPIKTELNTDGFRFKISNEKERIINAIMDGFSTHNPSDPYGDLSPLYRDALNKNFGKTQNGFTTYHYTLEKGNKVATVGSATIEADTAYLNNLTTLQEFRGLGFAKKLIQFMINDLVDKKVNTLILVTEKDAYTELLYKKLGFKTFDVKYSYVKK